MINVILVDDEIPALEQLAHRLSQIGNINIAGKYSEPAKALDRIKEDNQLDAVFLDIEMREIDGFSLAREILKLSNKLDIVFATAYNEYAVKAFEINAVDYVLKPFDKERLELTVRKLQEKRNEKAEQSYDSIKNFIQLQVLKQSIKKVHAWKDNSIHFINPCDILFFTVKNGAVDVFSKQGIYESRESLSFWEDRLKEQRFFRCHKNHLVNLDKVKQAIPHFNYTYVLKIEGIKEEIPVSRSYLKTFKELMLL